ncbi:hypothetical protein BHE74_00017073 [Ensete ventricosum]|nr:hypothetical protein BHE74_00017073 [Ensete ventricosum]
MSSVESNVSEFQNIGHSQRISPWEVARARFHEKNAMVINFAQSRAQSRVSIDFSCTVSEFQYTSHSQSIGPSDVVRAWFHKKCDGHKLYFRSVFRAPSRNFNVLAIPNVLAHGKSYKP